MPWPLAINSLGSGHTHAHIPTIRTGSILRNQVRAGFSPAHTWFKKFCPNIYICTKTQYRCCKIMLNTCSVYNPYLQCNDRVMKYGTNHPQLKRHTRDTRMCATCAKQKTCVPSNHSCTRVCTQKHACKMNAPHTRTYPYEVSVTKRSSLQTVVHNLRM